MIATLQLSCGAITVVHSPWSREVEQHYHQFIQDGGAANFITGIECIDEDEEDEHIYSMK